MSILKIFIALAINLHLFTALSQDTIPLKGVRTSLDYYHRIMQHFYGKNYYLCISETNYFSDIKAIIYESDVVSNVTHVTQEKLNSYFDFWKANDNFIWSKELPAFKKTHIAKALQKNKTPVSVSGLLILPEGYIVTVLSMYCKGLCMSKVLYIFKRTKENEMNLIHSEIIDIT